MRSTFELAVLGLVVLASVSAVCAEATQATHSGGSADPLAAEAGKIANEDPLGLESAAPADYSNWANVLSQVLLKKEGTEDRASRALHRLLLETHEELVKISAGTGHTPLTALTDPVFMDEYGGHDFSVKIKGKKKAKPPTNIFGFITSKVFINYAPCIFQTSATGIQVGAIGANISPSLINIAPVLAAVNAVGVNFAPSAITIVPSGILATPAGINVQPSLLAVLPSGLLVTPSGIMVTPEEALIQPTGMYIGPAGTQVTPIGAAYVPRGISVP